MTKIAKKIGFIGAGNMAQAIAFGLIDAGAIDAQNITVSAPSDKNIQKFKEAGVIVTHDNNDVIANSEIIFVAVKPQYLDSAILSLSSKDTNVPPIPYDGGKLYVSILAGVKIDTLQKKFFEHNNKGKGHIRGSAEPDPYSFKIVRVLPNIAALVGAGCSVMAANRYATEEEVSLVKSIMSVGGSCDVVPENLINSCSAVCGSGPAFIFMVIEALADGAVLRGVPRDLAMKLSAKAVEGAGKLVQRTGKHPGQLKDEVCSPGGTTITGVHKLEESGLRGAFMNAVVATSKRADELSTSN